MAVGDVTVGLVSGDLLAAGAGGAAAARHGALHPGGTLVQQWETASTVVPTRQR